MDALVDGIGLARLDGRYHLGRKMLQPSLKMLQAKNEEGDDVGEESVHDC